MAEPVSSDEDPGTRTWPLVLYCQRVAANNLDSIETFGDDFPFSLVKPILEHCTVEQLIRLEESTPHIRDDTNELWKQQCLRLPILSDRYHSGNFTEPDSWRKYYYLHREEQAQRLVELSSKLRNQRSEADERKKEREVKRTDKLTPEKRAFVRGPVGTKSLLQKARVEASKIQKAIYPVGPKPRRPISAIVCSKANVLPPPSPDFADRVAVSTVKRRRTSASSVPVNVRSRGAVSNTVSSSGTTVSTPNGSKPTPSINSYPERRPERPPVSGSSDRQPVPNTGLEFGSDRVKSGPPSPTDEKPPDRRPPNLVRPARKDPMASIFMPKHRQYSQLQR